MSETKHTPRPWKAIRADLHSGESDHDCDRWSVVADKPDRQYFVATIENGCPGDTLRTEAANAHLVAAAPDLLEAVEAMLEEYEAGRNIQPFEIREMCRAAKFKAYGEDYE